MRLLDDQIICMYQKKKMSCAEIARRDGRSETTVYHILRNHNVELRDRSEANQIFPDIVIITLYNVGLSCSQVGRLLGIHPSTVTKRLHVCNFSLRDRNTANAIRYTEEEFKKYFCNQSVVNTLLELAGS